ncbi:MAG: hypothetical protein IKB30_02195 [Clostridia bacterium]|nr:hypothetical protein [Clostridia bacterium]
MIKALIKGVFKLIYKLISLFNLQFTLFVVLIGTLLYFTGTLSNNQTVLLVFQTALIISVVYAILTTIKKLLGIGKKVKKSKGMQIVEPERKTKTEEEQMVSVEQPIDKPKYYRVKQNPDYVMAEYSDKYELYRIGQNGLIKIRTDYKS